MNLLHRVFESLRLLPGKQQSLKLLGNIIDAVAPSTQHFCSSVAVIKIILVSFIFFPCFTDLRHEQSSFPCFMKGQ